MPTSQTRPLSLPRWMGNARLVIGSVPPYEQRPLAAGFEFGDAMRLMADVVQARFDVWAPGITDRDNPDMGNDLECVVHFRYGPNGSFVQRHVLVAGRSSKTALFALDLRQLDPWNTPRFERLDGKIELAYYFTVNGVALRPQRGHNFRGVFASSSSRAQAAEYAWFAAGAP